MSDSAGQSLPDGLPTGRKRASDEAAEERILFNDNRQQVCTRITTAGVASGDNDAIVAWFEANRDRLVFDAAKKRFRFPPSPPAE